MSVQATNYVFRACGLQDPTCRAVLGALAWRSKPETPHLAYMRHADLMEDSGLRSENGLKAALRRLQDAGELRVLQIGGRVTGFGAVACEYELLKLQGWVGAGEPSRHAWKVSVCEPKVSVCDEKVSVCELKRPLTDTHRQDTSKDTKKTSADAPAPAASQPSLPSSAPVTVPRPKPPKFDPATIPLPHGAGFASAWAEYAQHRREKRSPITPTAAQRMLKTLSSVNEVQAVEALHKSIANSWTGVFVNKPADTPKVLHIPRTGPVMPSEAERRMLALEALQADRMKGAA